MANITPESGFATFEAPMSHETFGGHTEKENYGGVEITNPKTDTSAAQGVDACRVLTRAQWLCEFAKLKVTIGTNQGTTSVDAYKGQNGVGLSHAPDILWVSTGRATLTWDAEYTDEYSVEGELALTMAEGSAVNGTTFLNVVCTLVDARTVDVRFFDAAGSATTSRSAIVTVHTMGDS